MNSFIYLDHAATTPVLPEVLTAMTPYLTESYGNPSALHQAGQAARSAVEYARLSVARTLNADPSEIVFTSGGTESDNAAIFGAALAHPDKRHLITSPVEHHAVSEPLHTLEKQGYEIEIVPVDRYGRVDADYVGSRLRPDTLLVSIMYANNEVGTIQPVSEIGALCRAAGVLFHTDAVQAFGKLPINVVAQNIDMLSISAHKFYGPKGIGVLYVRQGVTIHRYQQGGEQERGRRAGTLNVPGIVGLGKAATLVCNEMPVETERLGKLSSYLIERIQNDCADVYLMGSTTHRVPGNVHFCVRGVEGESLLLALDAKSICASAGAACSAGSVEPSHVLSAMGVDRELARGALRISLGRATDQAAIEKAAAVLTQSIRDLRALSMA